MAAKMRVADPNCDNGAFSSLTTKDAMLWLMAVGHINEIDPKMKATSNPKALHEMVIEKLRLALWDIQRFEYLFPDHVYSKRPNFKISRLETWPKWQDPHKEVWSGGIGTMKFDGFKDAERLNSYVMMPFNTMTFTQPELAQGLSMTPPKGPAGNWIGVKKIMGHATLDITGEGGRETPFVVYFQKDVMLIMELLDVKRVAWPKPGPKASSQFMTHLESRLREILPPGTSDDEVRAELQKHLRAGEEMPEEYLCMLARLLSHNADHVDKEWADDLQSHWNISIEAKKETRISFFVPCLRPRFRSCYCSPECAKAHWPQHKADCKISKKINSDPSSLPKDTLYVPVRAFVPWVAYAGFANEQEAVKMGGPPTDENPRNEYGTERFICRAILPNAGKAGWDPEQAKVVHYDQGGGTAVLFDRRRSVIVRLAPEEPPQALKHGIVIPFHDAGYQQFCQVLRKRGWHGQLLYVWVRRVGDCIEVDLKDIPDQVGIQWV
ncbi:hypothetical protein B0H17DRAFT_986325 [Mycena rosella]|uniref:MYND-type domain-containing protein n=1 Tax=Mycena rosella TaxID=1033263 RepID=A0AAD7GCL2_MYCRO|nr:hypothetical protein B0H17DRAFT_986325 [Mycena rosella]